MNFRRLQFLMNALAGGLILLAAEPASATASATATALSDSRDYTLTVGSVHGNPTPAVGAHTYAWQSAITASVDEAYIVGLTNLMVTGWTSEGLSILDSTSTKVVAVITNSASYIQWHWSTNYWTECTVRGAGSINFSNDWVQAGAEVTIHAQEGLDSQFYCWSGDVDGGENPLLILVDEPKQIVAVFVLVLVGEYDVPSEWLAEQGFDLETTDPEILAATDHDHDGYTTAQEYILGTSPTNSASALTVALTPPTLDFETVTGRLYSIEYCDNLVSNDWKNLTNNIPGSGNFIEITDEENAPGRFYRIRVRLAD